MRAPQISASGALAILLTALLFLGTGCALGRDVVDVRVAPSANPTAGPLVRIERVTDRRVFQANPPEANIPSLENADDIKNPAVTSRAIARKRGGFGKALGEIALPEGQTVAGLVEEALGRALQEAGYRVVRKGDPAATEGMPIEADIDQFWAWFRPGFWQVAAEFEARISMKAPMAAFQSAEPVKGVARVEGMAITQDDWQKVVNQGLEDLTRNFRERLKTSR
jgi:hypothetical protein